jgi:hypothetical protein
MNPKKGSAKLEPGVALWRAIKQAEIDDDIDEISSMSDEELDAYIASEGGDPAAIRAHGKALGEKLAAKYDARNQEVTEKLEALRAEAASLRQKPRLSRAELMARLTAARNDPRFQEPVATLFQKKAPEASTDEELQSLVDAIELLSKVGQA